MNPYKALGIRNYVESFFRKYFSDNNKRVFVFGINPGRFGAGLTGITFTDPVALAEFCGIQNNLPQNRELLNFHYLMDAMHNLCYTMGYTGGSYETPWQTPNTGKAEASGRPFVETRSYLSLGGPGAKRFFKLRGALVSNLQEEWPQRTEADAKYGTALSFVGLSEKILGARLSEGPLGSRLFDGSLDAEAYRPDRSEEFPSALLYRQFVESDERLGLELPETAEEGQGAQGTSDSLLETSRLAAYKKRPLGLEPAWPSWMKADSRLFQISKELGLSKEKPQSSLSPDAGQRSPLSLPLQSRPRESGSGSTRGFMPTRTFEQDKSDNSSGIFAVTSKAPSFFSGTEVLSIRQSLSINSLENILESITFTSLDTRLNLTPTNLSGQTSNEDWQTAYLKTFSTLDGSLIGRLEDSGILRDSYGRVFTHRTYRGHNVYPLFNESSVYTIIQTDF